MMRGVSQVTAVLVALALLAGAPAGPAGAESRNRALERVLERSMYPADEGDQIHRAFRTAEKAGAGERDLLALVEACADGEFDAAQTLRMLSLAAQLALADLPVEAFVAKLEEGVAKRADADRVVQAAATRAVTLNRAKSIIQSAVLDGLSRSEGEDLLTDVASALEVGRTPEEVRQELAAAAAAGEGLGAIRRRLFP
jgi:hypothetical protein